MLNDKFPTIRSTVIQHIEPPPFPPNLPFIEFLTNNSDFLIGWQVFFQVKSIFFW